MIEQRPAEVFPPGEFLRDELEARGWSQVDLAEILGRPAQLVNEIISGKRGITPETAKGLGAAFGTSPELWLNLEQAYKLWRLSGDRNDTVERRGRIFSCAPVSEMVKRGWISSSESVDILEKNVTTFFRIRSLDEPREFKCAARKSTSYASKYNNAQLAWLFRSQQLAETIHAPQFSITTANAAVQKLKQLMCEPYNCRQVPEILSKAGIRFVVVQTIPTCKIDGACFWLAKDSPVIALSMRYDRIDNFWFTVLHEIHHCIERENSVDEDLGEPATTEAKPPFEMKADEFAKSTIIDQQALDAFVTSTSPRFSRSSVEAFARSNHVHPGLVVGQLQHRKAVDFKNFRNTLVPVRDTVAELALTDGWGINPTIHQ